MADSFTSRILERYPDAFESAWEAAGRFAEQHELESRMVTYSRARELAILVAAMRASYVCMVWGGFGYPALHVASTFGHTGRLDLVEEDPLAANHVEEQIRHYAYTDRVHVTVGAPSNVVRSLNGPYDAVLVDDAGHRYAGVFDDLVRLLRTGGALVIAPGDSGPAEGQSTLFDAVLQDSRLVAGAIGDDGLLVAVRRR
ncbi:MAG: class I SAM-dependent methyltransferase [Dehalococcoidia bacterium]|nr:class I SAM-dependent methyltransferase [Dehalococcoidia bacterium]